MHTRRPIAIHVLLPAVLLLSACGSNDPGKPISGGPGGSNYVPLILHYEYDVTLSGKWNIKGHATKDDTAGRACAHPSDFVKPLFLTVNGVKIDASVDPPPSTGDALPPPGTYRTSQDESFISIGENGGGDDSYSPNFDPKFPAQGATLTVAPDGSGSYEFKGWTNSSSQAQDGKLTWTCTERR